MRMLSSHGQSCLNYVSKEDILLAIIAHSSGSNISGLLSNQFSVKSFGGLLIKSSIADFHRDLCQPLILLILRGVCDKRVLIFFFDLKNNAE